MAATIVHFSVLSFNIKILKVTPIGLANFYASFFGISASYIGSRYFVFNNTEEGIFKQAAKFSSLYGVIALLHGSVLYVWTDSMGLDYRVGFLAATFLQIVLSYIGNKFLVFKR